RRHPRSFRARPARTGATKRARRARSILSCLLLGSSRAAARLGTLPRFPGRTRMDLNLAEIHEAIAAAVPDRECIVFRDRRLTWRDVTDRTRRLANHLRSRGLGLHRERGELAGWQSGQDHLAIYLHNGNEYLEAMLGAFKARVAPFNVNYRYVAEELVYLLRDAGA